MEARSYRRVVQCIDQVCSRGRRRRQQFSDAVIVKVYFFATLWDRPVSWACDLANWTGGPAAGNRGSFASQPAHPEPSTADRGGFAVDRAGAVPTGRGAGGFKAQGHRFQAPVHGQLFQGQRRQARPGRRSHGQRVQAARHYCRLLLCALDALAHE